MYRIEYSPMALEDLKDIEIYISQNQGEDVVKKILKKIITNVRRLEQFPSSGVKLSKIIDESTDYYYLFTEKNYVFYRIEYTTIRIIRILNEQQD
jgi:plasmid stabilization system protein ParE